MQQREEHEIRKYGVADIKRSEGGGLYELKGIIEKPQGKLTSNLAALGRYIFTSEIFDILRRTKAHGHELRLTDAIDSLILTAGAYAYDFEGVRYDMGDKFGSVTAVVEFALKHPEFKDKTKEYIKKLAEDLK
jgi:UTP--glucose-1-phosphate uridylyltransferase